MPSNRRNGRALDDASRPFRPTAPSAGRVRRISLGWGVPVALLALLVVGLPPLAGCTWISYLGSDPTGAPYGQTWYVGGAGPFGHVGTLDVPAGLRHAGYRGAIETFGWQSVVGGTLRDQLGLERNQAEARRLARRITAYVQRYPQGHVNIIALSAGTGIATWALEALPEHMRVGTVIFLASSLSRDYDLGPALRRIDGQLYNFHSVDDPILRYGVPLTGTVDRRRYDPGAAGLLGFEPPPEADEETRRLYALRVRNKPHRPRYALFGYSGGHTDGTSKLFVQHVLAPLLLTPTDPEPAETAAPLHPPPATAK